jgi:tetratricopeptide (TPR) repeat protein
LWKKTEPAASTTSTGALASSTQLESLYQEALAAMDKEDWMQAVVTLEKLQLLQPDYRDVSTRLATARANLSTAENARFSSDSVGTDHISPYLKVALAALIAVPLLGFVAFSPAARARIHLLRGNYAAAMQIYEKILARSPDRVKLYPLLANIYLLMGRHDEHAMKIYKTILQLNLATNKREEINSIVAQNYLTEGRTDSDAISVLESALKAERQKQYQGNY